MLDDVGVVDECAILAACEARYNSELPIELQQGQTSIVTRWIAEKMAEKVVGKTFIPSIFTYSYIPTETPLFIEPWLMGYILLILLFQNL